MRHQQGQVPDADYRRPSFPANKSSIFYTIIDSSIIQDNKLKISGKFGKRFGNELPNVATLTTPNGCVWRVGLKKIDGKFWFTEGWSEFVEHQSVRMGYLVVFAYDGNSNFRVNIYDLASAEIKYRSNSLSSEGPNSINRCQIPYKGEAEDDDFIELFGSRPTCQTPTSLQNKIFGETVDRQRFGQQHVVKNIEARDPYAQYAGFNANGGNFHVDVVRSGARSTRDIGIQCSYGELVSSAYEVRLQSMNQRSETTKKRKRGIGPHELDSSAKQGSKVQTPGSETSYGTFSRRWRVVTPEEKERVLNASKMFQSENPFCRVILRRSYVYKGIGLHMPSTFAEKYLGGVSGFLTLQISSGEKWPVKCMWRDGSAKLSKGWPEFVRDNRLEEGDVCVFELIRVEEAVLKVSFFRVAEDAGPVNQLPKEFHGQNSQMAINYDLVGKLSF